jgi:hypothetical protein
MPDDSLGKDGIILVLIVFALPIALCIWLNIKWSNEYKIKELCLNTAKTKEEYCACFGNDIPYRCTNRYKFEKE